MHGLKFDGNKGRKNRCHMYEVQINQTGRGNKVDSWAWAPEWLVFPLLNSVSICRHLCT